MPSPLLIVGFLIALIVAAAGGYRMGHSSGIDQQKVSDQAQFDKTNADIANQKAAAFAIYREDADELLLAQEQRDAFKTKLEKEHVQNQAATAALERKYASTGLRFAADKDSGCGSGDTGTKGGETATASAAPPAVIELPRQITSDLRRLVIDADTLRDDYKLCYDYTQVAP